jgi:hypothetical protein
LVETTNWRALTGFGECGGGPAISQIAIPIKAAATKVGSAIALCRGIWWDRLQVPDVQEAGPAIFAIDEAKNECHGINSVVDRMSKDCSRCVAGRFRRRPKSMSSGRKMVSAAPVSGAAG